MDRVGYGIIGTGFVADLHVFHAEGKPIDLWKAMR